MASVTKDDIWKVFSLIMSVLVLPLAGWVWNTNIKVAELQNDLGDAEAVIVVPEHNWDREGYRIYEGITGQDRAVGDFEMNGLLFLALLSTPAAQETDDLKRDMKALELYLQDQEDHKNYCPSVKWEQPEIDIYKKELESQLPEGCKE